MFLLSTCPPAPGCWILISCLSLTASVSRAQGATESGTTGFGTADSVVAPAATPRGPARRERSVGVWAGGAPTSYAGHFIGATPGRAIALVGLRFGLGGGRLGPVAIEYVGQLIPAAFAYDNPVGPLTPTCGFPQAGNLRRGILPSIRPGYCHRRVYGAGALPIGVQLTTPLVAHVRAFVAGNAGALVFADNVPVPQARRLNFAFDFGGGLELGARRGGAVTVGYKLHHISNAWTAPSNPGIDHHVFYLGFVHRVHPAHGPAPNEPARTSAGQAEETASRR